MVCADCHEREAQEGRDVCFRCKIKGVSLKLQGGAINGPDGWNTSKQEFLQNHFGVSSDKELAKTHPHIGRYES